MGIFDMAVDLLAASSLLRTEHVAAVYHRRAG